MKVYVAGFLFDLSGFELSFHGLHATLYEPLTSDEVKSHLVYETKTKWREISYVEKLRISLYMTTMLRNMWCVFETRSICIPMYL
jgi:hypothetical protein